MSLTANLSLIKQDLGDTPWHTNLNTTLDLIDASYGGATGTPSFTTVNADEIFNTGAALKIQPDVGGDVVLFGDTDVADGADGKSLFVHRKAAEGDHYWQLYCDSGEDLRIKADAQTIFRIDGTTPNLDILPFAGNDVVLFGDTDVAADADGKRLWVHRKAAEGDHYVDIYVNQWEQGIVECDTDLRIDAVAANILLNQQADGDIVCFGNADVGDEDDGRKLIIHRKAAEGDTYLELFCDNAVDAKITSSTDLVLGATGTIYMYPTDSIVVGRNWGSGQNDTIKHYGYVNSGTRYVEWKVDDANDYFELTRSATQILGLRVNMPLVLDYVGAAPASLVNGMVWMESDGLHLYYNGAEKLVVGV